MDGRRHVSVPRAAQEEGDRERPQRGEPSPNGHRIGLDPRAGVADPSPNAQEPPGVGQRHEQATHEDPQEESEGLVERDDGQAPRPCAHEDELQLVADLLRHLLEVGRCARAG
jgi:hypothetical protein